MTLTRPSVCLLVYYIIEYLFLPRERLQSIVMSTFVCVCLSARISPEPHARSLQYFCACCLWPWLTLPPAGWRNPKGKGQFWKVFFHTDNALYSIAFGTHTKTYEPIEIPFGMSRLGPRNSVLRVGDDPWRGMGNFGWKMCPTSRTSLWIVNWTSPCSGVRMIGADTWLQALDESIIGREGRGWDFTAV